MSPPLLRQVFYISRLRAGLNDADIRNILAQSRRRNRSRDITGALAIAGDLFGQFIEGRADDMAPLVASLKADPRHESLRIVLDRSATLRAFGKWSMAFVYKAEMQVELERLYDGSAIADDEAVAVVFKLGPDSLMGEL